MKERSCNKIGMAETIVYETYWQQWKENLSVGDREIAYDKDRFDRIDALSIFR
ncbi:hypothetical protein [Leptolyngbya sp. FACHB-711]|uniref:hypothetical protein n=1 Tax=Leptolyngbya sp. FACHB-711 TaxID=2692813 RepID=UPI0016866C99|nr:hypothetical protein [Leptolyngbya sp. FACHB-711]MBD2024452.1 hypothetical protein [Leptolyngbya sp. FACHB-711]